VATGANKFVIQSTASINLFAVVRGLKQSLIISDLCRYSHEPACCPAPPLELRTERQTLSKLPESLVHTRMSYKDQMKL
jgi:hypothetical protein